MSTSLQQVPAPTIAVERRFYPRFVPRSPIFVAFHDAEESLLLNVSENGLLVSTPAELACNLVARLSISLNGLAKPVQVTARVLWSSEARKLAGIQLLNLSEHDRERIRKWGLHESAQPSHQERIQPLLPVAPDEMPAETIHGGRSFAEDVPTAGPRHIVPPASVIRVRARSTSTVERYATWGLYLATICLAAAFVLRSDVLGNPFARSAESRSPSSPPALLAQSILATPDNPESVKRAEVSAPATLAPVIASTKSKSIPAAAPRNSAKAMEAPGIHRAVSSPTAIAQTQRDDSQKYQSQALAIPAATDVVPGTRAQEQLSAAPDPPAMNQPRADSVNSANVLVATAPAIPANPASVPSTIAPSIPIAASARPTPSPKSDAPVIQMNPPPSQVLDVRLPRGYQASFFSLPGERVLESSTVTMHIQRSVLMPAPHGGWFSNRNKKVIVGELISRADPQIAQIPSNSGSSVRVSAIVARDGRIEKVRFVQGPASLAAAAAQALHEWRYQPTWVDDKPVETQCYVVIQFHAAAIHTAKR